MEKSESRIQAEIVTFARNELGIPVGCLFSVPNEGKRTVVNASRLIAQGLVSGVPDLVLCISGKVFFFEVKDAKGRASKRQELVHGNLKNQGFEVFIVRSLEDFKNCLSSQSMKAAIKKFLAYGKEKTS